ncbi:MAG TPA: hypothetical protein VGD89_08775 [Flavipsychrobacter sp.]
MEESRKNIDELFKQGLVDYTEQPPAEVWAALDSRLTGTHTPKPSYKWLWYLIAAVVVGTLLFYVIKNAASEKATKHTRVEEIAPSAVGNEPDNNANTFNPEVSDTEAMVNGGNKNALPEKEETKRNKINTNNTGDVEERIEKATNNKDKDAPHTGGNIGSTNGEHANTGTGAGNSKKPVNTGKATGANSNGNTAQNRNTDVNNKDRAGGATGNSSDAKGATSANTNRDEQAEKEKDVNSERASGNSKTTDSRTANNNTQSRASQKTNKQQGGKTRNTDNIQETTAANNKPGKSKPNNPQRTQQSAGDTNQELENNTNNTASNDGSMKTLQAKTNNSTGEVRNKPTTGGGTKHANSRTSDATKGSNDAGKSSTANNKNRKGENDRTQPDRSKEETPDNSTAKNENTTDSQTSSANSSVPRDNTGSTSGSKVPQGLVTQAKEDIKYESAFIADKNREGGIKVSDYMDTEKDGGKSIGATGDVVQKEEKPQAKGGGGTSAQEEEKKEKQNRKGKFDFGAKMGYEAGFGSYKANKIVVTPYVQYSIARNISILLQPTVKYATINKTDIGDAQAYYRKGATRLDSNHIYIPSTDTFVVDSIIRRYYHSGTYDSISVKSAIGQKKYWEIELPVLLQYKLSKQLSFFFGGSVNFSKVVQIKDELSETNGFTWSDSTIYPAAPDPSPRPIVPTGEGKVQYNGKPFNEYTGNQYPNTATNPIRVNLMFGVNYHVTDRLFFDLLLQQNVSNLNNIPNKNVRDIYKQSYIRVGIGYRFSK